MNKPKTKFELEYPYSKDWESGYLVTNSENRKTVILYNGINGNNQKRSSTQYARYKLSVSLSRYLTKDETVDHIDNDKTNNDLSNLQILSIGDNVRKSHKKPLFVTNCFICGKSFNVKRNLTIEQKLKCKNNELCCSRECGHKKSVITAKANRLTKLNP